MNTDKGVKYFLKLGACLFFAVGILSLVIGVTFSYFYWGYLIRRPGLPSGLRAMTDIKRVIPVMMSDDARDTRNFIFNNNFTLEADLAHCENDSYYCLDGRVLSYFRNRHLLPAQYSHTLDGMPDIRNLLRQSGLFVESDPGYDSEKYMQGIVIEGRDLKGDYLVFLAARGGEVSNDHDPLYEALFKGPDLQHMTFREGNRFFFDVAGIEGLEWYIAWLALWVAGGVTIVPIALITAIGVEIYKRHRMPNQAL